MFQIGQNVIYLNTNSLPFPFLNEEFATKEPARIVNVNTNRYTIELKRKNETVNNVPEQFLRAVGGRRKTRSKTRKSRKANSRR